MKQSYKITYISNAGVMLEFDDKKILIDGLCNSVMPIFKNPPVKIRKQIILGIHPFNNIDIMLFTHHHSDHFDSKSTIEFLKRNENTTIISTHEAILKINSRLSDKESSRLIKPNLDLGSIENVEVNGVNIQTISMIHEGKEYADVQNFAYLIDVNGKKILHVGDAKPIEENYINLNLIHKNIDLLIVPFPYVGIPAGRQVIEKYIKPKKIAAIHLPYKELDSYGWIGATKRSYNRVQNDFIETVFLEDIGDSISI